MSLQGLAHEESGACNQRRIHLHFCAAVVAIDVVSKIVQFAATLPGKQHAAPTLHGSQGIEPHGIGKLDGASEARAVVGQKSVQRT